MGITLHTRRDRHPGALPPRQTWSRQAIYDAARAGEGAGHPNHIFDLLMLLTASEATSSQLYGDVILGTSHWMLKHGIEGPVAMQIKPKFARLDIGAIRQTVRHYKIDKRQYQIAMLIAAEMEIDE